MLSNVHIDLAARDDDDDDDDDDTRRDDDDGNNGGWCSSTEGRNDGESLMPAPLGCLFERAWPFSRPIKVRTHFHLLDSSPPLTTIIVHYHISIHDTVSPGPSRGRPRRILLASLRRPGRGRYGWHGLDRRGW